MKPPAGAAGWLKPGQALGGVLKALPNIGAGPDFHPGDRGCLLSVYAENLGLALVVVANLICPGVVNQFTD